MVAGAYGLEFQEGRSFRWTEPAAMLRVSPPDAGAVVRIETGGIRGDPSDYLRAIYVGATEVPADSCSVGSEDIEIRLAPDLARGARERGIVLLSEPLMSSKNGSSDGAGSGCR